MKIYLDESGNLGRLGVQTSGKDLYFVIAALIVRDGIPIKRCIKSIRRGKIKKKYKIKSELKFSNSDNNIRNKILECIGKTDNDIAYVLLRKYQVKDELKDNPQLVYSTLCKHLLSGVLIKYSLDHHVDIIVDKALYGIQRENFDNYICGEIGSLMHADINVLHVDSRQCPCVQAVDFVAGAINRKYTESDDSYYRRIQNRISIELDFFDPGKSRL